MQISNRMRLLPLALTLAAAPGLAQTGTLDQTSPASNAGFNWSAPSLIWQQQVRVGVAGQLEGVEVFFTGPIGAQFDFRLRVGDGWNTSPVVYSSGATCMLDQMPETFFFDVSSVGLNFAVGDTFVWEVQGNDTGVNGQGSYVAPPGTPLYPEFLFLGGPGCFADCGWRLAFQSYMNGGSGPITSYCFGDGSGTPCPCGNTGAAGGGCATSVGSGGVATPSGSASAGADDLAFTGTGLVPGQSALLFVGENALGGGSGLIFGDGLRCAGQNVVRLGVQVPDGTGSAGWGPGLGALGGWSAGDVRYFQIWFRDPSGPCGSTFNLSQGVEVLFGT